MGQEDVIPLLSFCWQKSVVSVVKEIHTSHTNIGRMDTLNITLKFHHLENLDLYISRIRLYYG